MSNEKLTLEQLSVYSPYGLKLLSNKNEIAVLAGMHDWLIFADTSDTEREYYYDEVKLILRPLSDLTKEIEHNGEKFVPIIELFKIEWPNHAKAYFWDWDFEIVQNWVKVSNTGTAKSTTVNLQQISKNEFWLIQKLLSWHFDVFGLIDKGLAVSIHDVSV